MSCSAAASQTTVGVSSSRALYGELARVTGLPTVELTRAAAIAETGEVEAALALVDRLELDRYHDRTGRERSCCGA
jgi:predicted RNA polymerase sigma factor